MESSLHKFRSTPVRRASSMIPPCAPPLPCCWFSRLPLLARNARRARTPKASLPIPTCASSAALRAFRATLPLHAARSSLLLRRRVRGTTAPSEQHRRWLQGPAWKRDGARAPKHRSCSLRPPAKRSENETRERRRCSMAVAPQGLLYFFFMLWSEHDHATQIPAPRPSRRHRARALHSGNARLSGFRPVRAASPHRAAR